MKMKTIVKLMDVKTLVAGVTPVVLASIYSLYRYDTVSWVDMVILTIAMIIIQSCANMLNDYYGFKRGEDDEERADEKALASGEAKAHHVLVLIYVFLAIDLLIGIYYAIKTHYAILGVALVGVIVMYLYSGGKKPISHTPFGEFVAGSTMGFGIMTTVVYIQTGIFNLETTIVALPMAVYIGTILLTNNIADHAEDEKVGRKTLPIHIGIKWSEVLWFASCHSLLTFTAAFVFVGFYPLATLIVALVIFPYRSIYQFRRLPKNVAHKGQMMKLIGHVGIRYHMAIIIGLIFTMLFNTVVV